MKNKKEQLARQHLEKQDGSEYRAIADKDFIAGYSAKEKEIQNLIEDLEKLKEVISKTYGREDYIYSTESKIRLLKSLL